MHNQLLETAVFPLGDRLLGTTFIRELRAWRSLSQYSRPAVEALQMKRLQSLLLYCARHNPYYQRYLPAARNIHEQNAAFLLKSLPVLNKQLIREHKQQLISAPFQKEQYRLIEEKSSGSSGIQGSVFMTKKEAFQATAAQTHLWEWSGYRLGSKLLQLGITPERGLLKGAKDFLCRTTYKNAFHIDAEDVKHTLQQFGQTQNAFFAGYASGIYAYAEIAREYDLKVRFQSVISLGDKLFPHYRKTIESVFQTRVYDTYGCTEGFVIAGQCAQGAYHILTPHLYLEILDDNGNEVPPGKMGYVVATRLDCFSFPLIRYRLGDLAIRKDPAEVCRCGRPYPMLSMIVGRDIDLVYTPKGKPLIVHFFTGVFEHEQAVRQYRVIQKEDLSLLIEYITDVEDDSALLQRLAQRIEQRCGEALPLRFSRVHTIPASPSGKPQIVQSLVRRPLIQ